MSADDLSDLAPDARAALADAKRLVGPDEAGRARVRARLLAALPTPGGGGDGGHGDGGHGGAGPRGVGWPKAPPWVVGAALVVGGMAGYLVPHPRVERMAVAAPSAAVPPAVRRGTPEASSATSGSAGGAVAPLPASLTAVDLKDLPSLPTAPGEAAHASRSADLAAERASLDVARTALARGDGANALAGCDDHERRFPRGALAEEREAIAVQALVLSHRGDEARARAERFRRAHPRSILLPAVLAGAGAEP